MVKMTRRMLRLRAFYIHTLYRVRLLLKRLKDKREGRDVKHLRVASVSEEMGLIVYRSLGFYRGNASERFGRAVAAVLIVAIFLSQSLGLFKTSAASFTTTWTSQSDFESNTAGGISTTTVRSLTDTSTSPGDVKMGPGAAQTYSIDFSDSGLLDRWTMDAKDINFSTGVVTDQTGLHNGTFGGNKSATTNLAKGQIAEAANFIASSTNEIFLGSSTRIVPITGAYTLSAWVKTNVTNTTQDILISNAATCCGAEVSFAINFNAGGSRYKFSINHGSGNLSLTSNTSVSINTWYHLVVTWDGAGTAKMYVDGALDNTGSGSNPPSFAGNSPSSLIGGAAGAADFNGQIDDLRVYNRALSATEVANLYNTKSITNSDIDYSNTTARSNNGKISNQSVVLVATSTSDNGGSGGTPISFSYTTPSGNNRLLAVGISRGSTPNNISSVTYNGQALTKLSTAVGSFTGVDYWYLVSPPTGSNTLTVTLASGGELNTYVVESFNNVNQVTPFGTAVSGAKTDNPALDLTVTSATNELVNTIVSGLAATYTTSQYLTGTRTNSSNIGQMLTMPGASSVTSSISPNGFSMTAIAAPIKAGSSVIQSGVVGTVSSGIPYATISATDSNGSGSITYEMSNDGGSTWITATKDSRATFASSSGTQLKWRATLTGDATITSVSISYNGFSTSSISNLKKDAGGDAQWVSLSWNASLPSNTSVKFRTRGATQAEGLDALYAASWSDYQTSTSGTGSISIKSNGPGGSSNPTYRYLEIEADIVSADGTSQGTLNDFSVTYSINGPPDFNTSYPGSGGSGSRAFQVSTSTDSNWGKIQIDYSVRDADTDSGTFTPGFVTPSFEYRLAGNASWTAVSSSYLSSGATSNKAVNQSSYTNYTAYWDAKSQIPNQYSSVAQIRVTVNDNEIINYSATSTTVSSILDTSNPSVTIHINGSSSTSTVSMVLSDNSDIQDYELSNNSDYTADGQNGSSGIFQSVSTTSASIAVPWVLTGSASQTVYYKVRDVYGNIASGSVVAPAGPAGSEIHDLSNPNSAIYREFINWNNYTSQSGATFSRYEVYRSTDGSTYALLSTLSDSSVNYYLDGSLASSTTYYYKIRTVDTDGDVSAFSSVVSDVPDGQGGTDNIAPNISSVVIDQVKNTSARVTWTTDEISNSTVEYGLTNLYGGTATSSTYTLSHQVYLNNLLPNTQYFLKVKSTDIAGNTGTDDNSGSSYTFTTVGGPVISNVTVQSVADNSATIFWNTNVSSDSFVYYSTNSDLTNSTQVGSATLVTSTSSPFQHRVTLSGLNSGRTYYFYVKSTDSDGNSVTSDNNGSYYSFVTTTDTTAPVISNISTPVVSPNAVVVVWQTDEPATTYAEFGTTASTTSGSYASSTPLDSTLSVYHIATLSNLSSTTAYYYRVQSRDSAGNLAISDEETFTTGESGRVEIITVGGGGSVAPARNYNPPTISEIKVDPINAFDATVNIKTQPDTVIFIDYGEGLSYGLTSGDPVRGFTHAVKLKGLHPGSNYHFKVHAIDQDGNEKLSDDQTFRTKYPSESMQSLSLLDKAADLQDQIESIIESALPSVLPPFVEKPEVTNITEDGATVSWNTNVKSYSVVDYSTDEQYKSKKDYADELSDIKNKTTSHEVKLSNLKSNTKYHISARSFVFPQVMGKSPDITFNTRAAAVKAQVVDVTNNSFRVAWTTDDETTSVVEYTNKNTGQSNRQSDEKFSTNHDVLIQNLISGVTYVVKAYGLNKDGNTIDMKDSIEVTVSRDVTAPTINAIKIDSALVPGRNDRIQSVVSWKTDEPATSIVSYEEGSGTSDAKLKNKVEDKNSLVSDHVVILPNLKPGTIYRIQVSSADSAGNERDLPVRTIVTPRQNESIVDIIFKNFEDTFNFINNVK